MFIVLFYLFLVDVVVIVFVMFFIMFLLGWFFLNEIVGSCCIVVCIVGFIGILMVIQLNFLSVGWLVFYFLVVVFIFVFYMLIMCQIVKDIDVLVLQVQNGIIGCLILIFIFVIVYWLEFWFFIFEWFSLDFYVLFIIMGVGGIVVYFLMILFFRFVFLVILVLM